MARRRHFTCLTCIRLTGASPVWPTFVDAAAHVRAVHPAEAAGALFIDELLGIVSARAPAPEPTVTQAYTGPCKRWCCHCDTDTSSYEGMLGHVTQMHGIGAPTYGVDWVDEPWVERRREEEARAAVSWFGRRMLFVETPADFLMACGFGSRADDDDVW